MVTKNSIFWQKYIQFRIMHMSFSFFLVHFVENNYFRRINVGKNPFSDTNIAKVARIKYLGVAIAENVSKTSNTLRMFICSVKCLDGAHNLKRTHLKMGFRHTLIS